MKRSPHISDTTTTTTATQLSRLSSDATTSSNTNMRINARLQTKKNSSSSVAKTKKKRFHSSELQRQKNKLKPLTFPKVTVSKVNESTQVLVANFLQNASEKGELYDKTGVEYAGYQIIRLIIYYYLMNKYKTTCFMPNNMQDNVGGFKFNFRKSIHEIKYFNEESAAKHFNLVGPKIMEDNRIQLKNFIDCGPGSVDSHANMLVYRRDTNKLEHFEPHGKDFLGNLLISNYIERILQSIVGSINAYNVKTSYSLFKTPMELVEGYLVCPNVKGFQTIQEEFKTYDREGDGFCVMWSFFFQEMVLLNPDLTSKEVMTEIFEIVNRKDGPKFLTNIIRGYVVIVGQQIKLYLNQFINTGFTIENITYAIKMNDQLKLNIPKSPNNTIFIIAPIGDFQSYLFNLIFVIINSIYSNDQFVLTHS